MPYQRLEPETLRRLLEEFVTRDGTDYGDKEVSLEEKVGKVQAQLQAGTVKIVFDLNTESCNIIEN